MMSSFEQKLPGYIKLQEYLAKNLLVFDKKPHLLPLFEIFNEHLSFIIKNTHMHDEYKHYQPVKEELVSLASSFCRKITSYALLEEIAELQGMCFSPQELMRSDDQELIRICHVILSRALDCKNELEEYGIDDMARNIFSDLIERFNSIVNNRSILDAMEEQTDRDVEVLLKETDGLIDEDVRNILVESNLDRTN